MKPAGLVQAREGVKVVISGQLATARICERAGERRAVDDGEEFAEELSFFEQQLCGHEAAEIDFWQEACNQDVGTKD